MILNSLELTLTNLNDFLIRNNLSGKFSVNICKSNKVTTVSNGVELGCEINTTKLVYTSNHSDEFEINLSTVPLGFVICEEDVNSCVNKFIYHKALRVISDFLRISIVTKVSKSLVTNPCDIDNMVDDYECIKDLVSVI